MLMLLDCFKFVDCHCAIGVVCVDVEFILFMGRNVVMEQSFGATKVTKDGVNTAKSIEFKGKVKNVSFRLVVHVANATNDVSQYQIAWFCGC